MKKIATLIAVLFATAAFAAETVKSPATTASAPVAKLEKKAEVKPHKSSTAKADKKVPTATTTTPAVK
jgi:hypothetical protein